MKKTSIALISAILLSACGPSLTPQQKQERAYNQARTTAALKTAKVAQVNGKAFRVAVIEDRTYALVKLMDKGLPYTASDIESAARKVTGCQGEFAAGVLAFLGGDIRTANIGLIDEKRKDEHNGWRVDLTC